ncbi:MAG: hypothetical protein K1X66_07795 [Verrucomicrobiae bacterium]|nr:hypothetical protein [Verrucomicrobiae bacterium]
MRNPQKSVSDHLVKWFPLLLVVGVLYFVYQRVVVYISPGYKGILIQGNQVQGNLLNEGFHFKWPFFSRIEFVNLRLLNYEVNLEGYSKDLQPIRGKVNLLFILNPDNFPKVYQKIGNSKNLIQNLFIPTVKTTFQNLAAQAEAKEWIIHRENMANQFQQNMQSSMNQLLQPLTFEEIVQLKSFSLTELRLPNDLLKMWQANSRSELLIQNIQREANALKGNEAVLSLRTIEKLNDSFTSSNLIRSTLSTNLNLSTSVPARP